MISLLLCLLPSAALFIADDLSIWFFFLSVPTALRATQGALILLERWSEYWCLPLSPRKCEASFSVNPHFSKHVSSLKANFFAGLTALRSISASSWGPLRRPSLSLLYKVFIWPLLTYVSPEWFPFVSVTNITKLECFHQAASCAITGCLSSFPIPFLLSEDSLPLL